MGSLRIRLRTAYGVIFTQAAGKPHALRREFQPNRRISAKMGMALRMLKVEAEPRERLVDA